MPHSAVQSAVTLRSTPLQCDALLLGSGLALLLRGERRDFTRPARFTVAVIASGFFLFQLGYYALHHAFCASDFTSPFQALFGCSLIDLFAAGLLLLAIDARTRTSRLLETRVLRWIGSISYGFYVFHDIPHVAYERLAKAFPGSDPNAYGILTGALAFCGTLLLSALSFRYLELPFLRMKSRFVTHSDNSA